MEKMVVKQKILVNLPVLSEAAQPIRKRFDVLQGQPVLVELFVHAVHISDDAFHLHTPRLTFDFNCPFSCFIWLASSKIFASICLSQPFSKASLETSSPFLSILLSNSAYFTLCRSLTRFKSELN
jgi:hypothetical protein